MDKKTGVCIVGFGNFGKKLYSHLEKMPEFRVKYLYHPDPEKSAKYGPLGSSDLEKIMADSEVDAFVISTPHDQHAELLFILAGLGRHHIFVEKPMTDTYRLAECVELIMLNKDFLEAKAFMVGHNQRREAVFRKAKELLDRQAIGKLVDAHFDFSHGGAFNIGKDNWRYRKDRVREGPLITLGSHMIDTSHYLFGRVNAVYACVKNLAGKTDAPDYSSVVMTMADGINVHLRCHYCVPSEKRLVISGTDGVIYIDRERLWLRLGRDTNKLPTSKEEILLQPVDTIREELQEFVGAIMAGKKVETGFREGLAVMKVLEACYQSSIRNMPEFI